MRRIRFKDIMRRNLWKRKKALLCGSVLVLFAALIAFGFMTAGENGSFGGDLLEDAVGFCMQYVGVA